jgi:DNA polymerase I-like protein with 3'-5' exonuclease and polymerase domains
LACTQVAATLLAEGSRREPPDLDACIGLVLRERIDRPALDTGTDEGAQRHAARCAEALVPMMRAIEPMLRKRELERVFDLECALVPAVSAMERAGLGCDAAAFERVAQSWRDERAVASDPDRVARLDKLISTYAHWPRDFIRGDRVHCRLHALAADSGRFSCTDPNLQQVPSEHTAPGLRACFRAPPGHVLVVADYAQIELRVAAHLAPCDALRTVFREGRDPHRATAATITGRREDEITAHERKLAKAVNFGFLFGMGAPRFREYAREGYGVELDEGQARRAREAFLATFPGIAAWHRRVAALEKGGGTVVVRTALGRRKRFPAGRFAFNAALNIPVQGTAADGFKRAMIDLHPRLLALGGRGVLCVHDEYIAEVPRERADLARDVVVATMRDAMASVVTSVPIDVEARVGECWG